VALSGPRALLLGALFASVLVACGDGCRSEPPAGAASKDRPLRCGDFLVAAEITALGLDASRLNPDQAESDPVLGVRCDLGKVSVTIFAAAQYPVLLSDMHAAVAAKQLLAHPGPRFGNETHWTRMGERHGLLFLSTSKRYAASLAGRDQALLESLAQRLDARMK
jgi:hypothetical protein